MNLRRAIGATAALGLTVVGLQLAGVQVASAHDASVRGVASCAQDGSYTVTWSITNTNTAATETATSTGHEPSGSTLSRSVLTIAQNKTVSFTQRDIPSSATSASVSFHSKWTDNFEQDREGSVNLTGVCALAATVPSADNGACVANKITSPSIDIPKQSGISYTIDGKPTRSGTHFVDVGKHVVTASSGTRHLTGHTSWTYTLTRATGRCTYTAVKPASPDLAQARCTSSGSTTPTLSLPETKGITYSTSKDAPYSPGQDVKVTAKLDKGYRWGALSSAWHKASDTRATRTVRFDESPACNGFDNANESNVPTHIAAPGGPNGGLAATGSRDFGPWLAVALTMLALGGLLVRATRRRIV